MNTIEVKYMPEGIIIGVFGMSFFTPRIGEYLFRSGKLYEIQNVLYDIDRYVVVVQVVLA